MSYQETVNWMFEQLPAYQKIGKKAYKADLVNIKALAKALKHPEQKFKSIHVGGTNGKGSSSHMLASILQAVGYKVGLYTSPHLKDFRERIKINGVQISKTYVVDFVAKNKTFFKDNSISFFEMTVGLAFDYFAAEKVDIAIIEVGLGGRLDATNIINPEVSLITNIGIDHTAFLGTTLPEIAKEKAGIIKLNTPIVISETQAETASVFIEKSTVEDAAIQFADKCITKDYKTDLLGSYQTKNIRGVLASLKVLPNFTITEAHINEGLLNVVKNTGLLGRWQILQDKPKIICDTAHNREGLSLTMKQLVKEECKNLHIVLGVMSDKDLTTILPLFPLNARYYFCSPNILRAMTTDMLYDKAIAFGLKGEKYPAVYDAFSAAKNKAGESDVVYVGGSTFVVAEIL